MPKDPQELLARWASDEILDPYGPVLDKDSNTQSTPPPVDYLGKIADPSVGEDLDGQFAMTRTLPLTTDELTASTPKKRSAAAVEPKPETPQTSIEIPKVSNPGESPAEPQDKIPTPVSSGKVDSIDSNAEISLPVAQQPDVPPQPAPKRQGGSLMVLGQILAYVGVLSLTIGSTFVLWGFFGDKPHYAPMGWLILTAGQMLLFLGIVTLVSGGIEQTSSNVDIQFAALNEHILSIEQSIRQGTPTAPSAMINSKLDESQSRAAA